VLLKSIFQALSNGIIFSVLKYKLHILNKTHKIKISHLRAQAVMSKESRVGVRLGFVGTHVHFLLLILRR